MGVGNRVRGAAWAVMLAALPAAARLLGGALGQGCGHPLACRAAGAVLLAVVVRAAAVTGRYLAVYGKTGPGRGFGELDRLVTEGPYSCMRHPMHFFLAWLPLAVALLLASPGAVLVALLEAALVLTLAVTLDERESIARFGDEYLAYRRRVPAFNPSPHCLARALGPRPPKHGGEPRG